MIAELLALPRKRPDFGRGNRRIRGEPHFRADRYEVGEGGSFSINDDSTHGLVLLGRAASHACIERRVQARASGRVRIDFVLPVGQPVTGRVLDGAGKGVEGATVHVRYHEPGRPLRLVRYEDGITTDGDGVFRADVVGVNVPFYLDVYAPSYPAVTSDLIELPAGRASVPDIVLDDPVGLR